jgi:Bifunctional DNA primase/polymerase, N-terminal/AAA domain/SMODS and SLOG-associating 2TM effector domain 1
MASKPALDPGPPEVLAAAGRGWRVFPCHSAHGGKCSCGKLDCDRPGKHPRTRRGHLDATTDEPRIGTWAQKWPGSNWGMATGEASGVVAIDVDGMEGRASLADLEQQGLTFPTTLTVTTGRADGGEHRYYRAPAGVNLRNDQSGKIGIHIDVRGTGGYVVIPPSIHPSSKQYRFIDPDVPIAELPGWVIERLTVRPQMPPATLQAGQRVFEHPHRTPELTKEIGAMLRRGWPIEIIEQTAMKINDAQNLPPLAESKVIKTVREMARRYKDQGVERYAADSGPGELRADLICLATVAPRAVDWLWEPYIPARMLTMISGDPGAGKTFIALAVAACFTTGRTPDGQPCEPINVLYLSVENAPAEVVRPRLDLLGGNPSRFYLLPGSVWTKDGEAQHGAINLSDVAVLENALKETRAKLVIVDPIQSYLGAKVDLHRSNETRPVMDGLARLAERHGCEVNRTSLPRVHQNAASKEPMQGGKDSAVDQARMMERVKFLNPEEYLRDRVDDQIDYFVDKTGRLSRQLKRLQIFIVVAGGLGTFLAAIGGEVWVALTTAVATALTNKLEIEQVENSLVQYNMALTNLRNVESWWKGLSPWERTRQKNLDLLVDQAETTLEHETTGWVQQMQSTLDKLTEKESNPEQNRSGGQK